MSSGITYRGAVLFARFGETGGDALEFHDCRELATRVERHGGIVVESAPQRLVAFFPRPDEALAQARALAQRFGGAPGARIVLSFGTATLRNGRLRSEWSQRLPDIAAQLSAGSIAATREFVDQFAPPLRGVTLLRTGGDLYSVPREDSRHGGDAEAPGSRDD